MKRDHARLLSEQHMDALRRLARLQQIADVYDADHIPADPHEAGRRLARLQAIADLTRRTK